MTARHRVVDRSSPRAAARYAGLALIASLALGLAACSASGSSSEQLPIGPAPSISVLLRVGGDAGTSVQLLGTGTDQATLDAAAGAVARTAFPNAQAGAPEASSGSDPALTVSTVPVQLSTGQMTFDLHSDGISAALKPVHPKALGVWVCTDDRRSLAVETTAPGAVSSDVVSGQCQVAGSILAHDGHPWTATVSVGAVGPPSKLPWLIGAVVVVVLIVGLVWLFRSRRPAQEPVIGPPLPPAPPVH